MCGIAGILKLASGEVDAARLRQMIDAIRHRGPDAQNVFANSGVGLANARLSIVDIAGGGQPMSNADGSLWITFNGEIFNHIELREELLKKGIRFATHSDTEVILHLYRDLGEECVHRLNGQWAFAIWDARRRKLFLSRDRVGIQPLFYTVADQNFIFGSEVKAIFACPEVSREIDLQALDQFFTFWVSLPPRTIFRNISQLPPGHSLTVENGRVRVRQYWQPDYSATEPANDSVMSKAEELLELMSDATRIRLRADIPVGAYLSGGIDSSFITALARPVVDKLRTFSVAFDDPELDESKFQREASAHLRTEHSEIRCSPGDIGRVFPEVIWHTEQPVLRAGPAPLFLLSDLVHRSGFKVVLTGEGADELLGGYDIFKEAKIRRFWGRQPGSRFRPQLLKRLYPYMQGMQKQPEAYLANFFRVDARDTASPFFSHLPRWQLTAKLKGYFSPDTHGELADYDAYSDLQQSLPSAYAGWPEFCQAQYLETAYLLPGYILSAQGDRVAMAHSVEARYPFLDHRVIEFCQKLHPALKMRVLAEKYLLKKASQSMLPSGVIERPKQPYRAPDGASFLNQTSPKYVEELLSQEKLQRDGIFSPAAVLSLVAKFKKGRVLGAKDNMALVGILSTQLLVQQFISSTRPTTYAFN
ncbi:MAG TPA: asparagine synthase (glutamine-hydrolyzing) [Terriglobales bacterium]|nr:asparagine synthase (glutamine-hydrolyzing) [Terriglobales bacterium]